YDTIGTFRVSVSASGWAKIGGSYTVSSTETALLLYAQLVGATSAQSFYIDDVVIKLTTPPPLPVQTDIPQIYQVFADYFPVGAEIDTSDITGEHAQLLTTHFNSIVSGNDMKWSSVENVQGTFNYSNADAEVAFAKANNLKVRGHNLIWSTGSQTPSWVFLEADGKTALSASNPADVALLTQRIQTHIQQEVQHFGSAVYVWDVINEPFDNSQADCLQHGPFYQILGKSYLDIALTAARQYTPPGTELFINDYNTTIPAKLACVVQVLQDLKSRGIPIDGIGHEAHNSINFPAAGDFVTAVNTLAADFPGIHQQITELDVSVYGGSDNTSDYGTNPGFVPPAILAEQAWLYEQSFAAFRQLKGKLEAVTFWGFADDNTWLSTFPIARLNEPLPFDAQLQAKSAYWGMVDPTQLPGYGLRFNISKTGAQNARVWTVTATNPSSGTAYTTQIGGLTLTQVAGAACTPVITPPSTYPVVLGDIASGGTASASFTINFTGCSNLARFALRMPWSSAVYETGTFALGNQFR
ncbi:MAG: endo-1,4-beta-xylanase, partial [Acidobacteriia bacterium]|nr:endo-1,4-beta-xylanase [Terriglobia bacterium]